MDGREVHYRLTPNGMDAGPVMTALPAFGPEHVAKGVFKDGQRRG